MELPISDALVERLPGGDEQRLPREKYYVPGSVLRMSVDDTNPLTYGVGGEVDVFFDYSPVFRLHPDAAQKGVRAVAWFDDESPLRSGWAWGQRYLAGGVGIVDASVGEGKLFLYGPEVTFRGQPHGTRHVQVSVQRDLLRHGADSRHARRTAIGAAVTQGSGQWIVGSSCGP